MIKVSHKMVTKTLADCSNVIVTGQNYVKREDFLTYRG